MLDYSEYIKIFISLLAIVNPFGAIPLFISITDNLSQRQTEATIKQATAGVAAILLIVLFFGELLLTFFGISIDSFRVGGGILILLMAIAMLHAKTSNIRQTDAEASESVDKESVAIVPLAIPMLAGPGAISTVILAAHKGSGLAHYGIISLGILLLSLLIWLALHMAPWISARLGKTGINIFTRIMGLILAAIAIEFIANGFKGIFPVLAYVPNMPAPN